MNDMEMTALLFLMRAGETRNSLNACLVFYCSAISRDIDLKFVQDTYMVVINSLKNIDFHRSKVKVQSYHKN